MSQHFHYMKPLASKNVEKVQRDYERYQQKPSSKFKIEDIREMSYTLPTNYSFTIYRLYLTAVDSGELSDVGWVINDRNSFCLLCFKDFGVRRWKHHCRACGSLVCKECSNFESELISFEPLGPQKVCQSCYKPNGGAALRISRKEGTSLVLTEAPPQPAAEEKAEETQEDSIDETFYNQTIEVIPLPGYVVKTRRDDDSKVFINIYHHDSVKDEFLLLLRSVENNTNIKPEDTMMIPTVYLGEKKATIDKNGAQSTLYTIVISSKYFEIENEKKSTNPLLIQKIIDVINLNYQDHLIAEEYVRPKIKVGFQGLPIINPEPFVLNRHLVSMILRIQDDETRSAGRRPSALDDDTASRRSSTQPTGSVTANAASRPNSNRSGNARTLRALTRNDSSLSNHGADNASEISDMTQSVATDASSTVGGSNMLSVSQYFYATSNIPDGRSLLTSEMLRHTKELSITSKESSHLVEESTRKPSILIGWQIMLFGENENLNGVFVITGTRKNHLRKTEYRISNLIHEDQWIKLRRNEQKTGIEFRPLRKVLSTI